MNIKTFGFIKNNYYLFTKASFPYAVELENEKGRRVRSLLVSFKHVVSHEDSPNGLADIRLWFSDGILRVTIILLTTNIPCGRTTLYTAVKFNRTNDRV